MMAISVEIRARIIGLSEGGKTGVDIAAIVGVPVRQFRGWWRDFEKMEPTEANLVVEIMLRSLVIEMFVLLNVSHKLIVA